MLLMPLILVLILLAAGAYGFRLLTKHQSRQKLLAAPLSDQQRAIVIEQVPLYHKLPFELRGKLEGKINLFLRQIEFIGCNGLEVTEEMRLSIAAQACLLIANKDMWYNNLRTILIYPSAFKSREKEHHGYVVTERETVRVGESWARGPVILSWAHAAAGSFIDDDGHNVVLHEFAHQLDDLSGYTNGAPILNRGHSPGEWDRVFSEAYERLVNNVEAARKTFVDPYGANSPEEFFAVVVEFFFERPAALKREEPAVYEQMSKFFKLEPSIWV
jgi:Mlc titration factor MtfA (ptsG expression regulator)